MRAAPCSWLVLAAVTGPMNAQHEFRHESVEVAAADGHVETFRFRLLTPPDLELDRRYPLILFLHGAGERGDDNDASLRHMPLRMLEPAFRARYPCYVVVPQCRSGAFWVDVDWSARDAMPMQERPNLQMRAAIAALQQVQRDHLVDPDRVYLTGLSMGGYGAWDLGCRHPDWFAAIAPVCGGGDPRAAAKLRDVPVWAWHGAVDPVVPASRSRAMVDSLRAAGGAPRYTELEGVAHASWHRAYEIDALWPWLFSQSRTHRRRSEPIAPFVPWPARVTSGDGTLSIANARIVADARLAPHAAVLSGELPRAVGLDLDVVGGPSRAGDIELRIDERLPDEGYRLSVGERVVVSGRDVGAVARGTATLLQAARRTAADVVVPRCEVDDRPGAEYRSVMIDCARHTQSIATLEQVVELCRLYKIRYLQLHLTDNEAFTFPSARFAKAVSNERHYTLDELRALEAFARDRGVTIVPELDVPGHSAALVRALPDVFGLRDWQRNEGVLNIGREAVYDALAHLVGEVCDVFRSSPFFHIGGDEVWLAHVADDPDVQAYLRAHDLADVEELYRHFLVRMHGIVARHGKRTLVWEGFAPGGNVEIPRDVVVLAWEGAYYPPDRLLRDGYTVVNASWQPLYVVGGGQRPPHKAPKRWSAWHLYRWNVRRWEHFAPRYPTVGGFDAAPDASVFGAQMCVWEQIEQSVVRDLRPRLAAFAERLWHERADRGFADFEARFSATDALVERVLGPLPPEVAESESARVRYRLYASPPEGFAALPDFEKLAPLEIGTQPRLEGWRLSLPCGLMLDARLDVPQDGEYELWLESSDGIADLWIDGALVVAQFERKDWKRASAKITLTKGRHDLRVRSAQGFFHALCRVWWRGPGMVEPQLVDPALSLPE
jgi:hexosaminidase